MKATILAIALALASAVASAQPSCIQPKCSNGGARCNYYVQFETCNAPEVDIDSITASLVSWHKTPNIEKQENLPTIGHRERNALWTLEWAVTQAADAGFLLIDTHGAEGGFDAEWAADEAGAMQQWFAYTDTHSGPFTPADIYQNGRTLGFKKDGIYNKFSPACDGIVIGIYCSSYSGRTKWKAASFLGYDTSSCACRGAERAFADVMKAVRCAHANVGHLHLGEAIPPAYREAANLKMNITNGDIVLQCGGCASLASGYERTGAFRDTVWGIIALENGATIRVVGYTDTSEWPEGGSVLRTIQSSFAGREFYSVNGVDRRKYPWVAFEMTSPSGRRSVSELTGWSSRPKDWDTISRIGEPEASQAELGEVHEVFLGADGHLTSERPINISSNPVGAEAGLYAVSGQTDAFLPIAQANLIQMSASCSGCAPAWSYGDVRLFTGDGTVASQQAAAAILKAENENYIEWCAQHPAECSRTYPATPVYGILGDDLPPFSVPAVMRVRRPPIPGYC